MPYNSPLIPEPLWIDVKPSFWYDPSTMLMIRLQRVGRRHDPSYRVVVTEKTAGPKAGKPVEVVGSYDARQEHGKDNPKLNEERVKYWMSQGAQPSGTVHNLLVGAGIVKGDKINVLPKRKPVEESEEKKEEAAPAAEGGEEAPAEGGEEAEKPAEETPAEEETKAEEASAEDKKEETEENKEE